VDIGLAEWLEVGLTMRLLAQQKLSQNRDLIVPRQGGRMAKTRPSVQLRSGTSLRHLRSGFGR
jgi:hypothetical protein